MADFRRPRRRINCRECEHWDHSRLPKIEVFRRAAHREPLYDPSDAAAHDYLAIVADSPVVGAAVPVIRLDDEAWLATLADLVEQHILRTGP